MVSKAGGYLCPVENWCLNGVYDGDYMSPADRAAYGELTISYGIGSKAV
jgi:hypothetical protein